jgi:hypothetical protein
MKHTSFSVAGASSAPIIIADTKAKRMSFLASLLEALHHSRRIEARRFLGTHRHLIAGRGDLSPKNIGENIHADR